LQKTEFAKKSREMGEEISKSYGRAAESISKSGQHISQSAAFKGISQVCIHFDQCNVGNVLS
jgi:hypothetical protein